MKENEKTVAVRMEGDLYNKLLNAAEQDSCSVSAIVRRACKRYAEMRAKGKA